jgi:hypothetical protein
MRAFSNRRPESTRRGRGRTAAPCNGIDAEPRRAILRVRTTLISLLATLLLGFAPNASAIRVGTLDPAGQFSGVGMLVPSSGDSMCSGTLLGNAVFLTAAQCFVGQAPGTTFEFALGGGQTAHVTQILSHPLFNTPDGINLAFDLALVALDAQDVTGWNNVKRWAVEAGLAPPGDNVSAAGFGETGTGTGSGQLRSGSLAITQYVLGADPDGNIITDAFIETLPADALGQTFCAGDTGGPLIHNGALAGINSFRFVAACDEPGAGYSVSLPRLAGWIAEGVRQLDVPGAIPLPEPGTFALLALGLAGFAFKRRTD